MGVGSGVQSGFSSMGLSTGDTIGGPWCFCLTMLRSSAFCGWFLFVLFCHVDSPTNSLPRDGHYRAMVHTHLSVRFFWDFQDSLTSLRMAAFFLSIYFSQLSLSPCPSWVPFSVIDSSIHIQLQACKSAVPFSLITSIKFIPKLSILPHKYLKYDPSSSCRLPPDWLRSSLNDHTGLAC